MYIETAPLVTVVMPAFNAERHVGQAIESILGQTLSSFELIVIDDASTDSTLEVARSYSDPRITVVELPDNVGGAAARNHGLDMARGEFVACMDADDIALRARLERQLSFMRKNPEVGICGSWIRSVGQKPNFTVRYSTSHLQICADLLFQTAFAHPSLMMRMSLLNKFSLRYDPDYRYCEDYELWLRASECLQMANIPEVLTLWRVHPDSVSHSSAALQREQFTTLRNTQLRRLIPDIPDAGLFDPSSAAVTSPEERRAFIVASEKWLVELMAANAKQKIFDDAALRRSAYWQLMNLCRTQVSLGMWLFKFFMFSKLARPADHVANFVLVARLGVTCALKSQLNGAARPGKNAAAPRVSVIMPAHNCEQYIRPAIDSILGQTFSDLELIIVDDASSDSTVEIAKSYKDPRVKIIELTENAGSAAARNHGLDTAAGEYVALLDADDVSLPKRLSYQVTFMDAHPQVGICGTWMRTIGRKLNYTIRYPVTHDEIRADLVFQCPFIQSSIIMRRSLIDKFNLRYQDSFIYSQDYEIWVRAVECFEAANIPKVLTRWRVRSTSVSHAKAEEQAREFTSVRIAQFERLTANVPKIAAVNLHALKSGAPDERKKFIVEWEQCMSALLDENLKKQLFDHVSLRRSAYKQLINLTRSQVALGPWVFRFFLFSKLSSTAYHLGNLGLVAKLAVHSILRGRLIAG